MSERDALDANFVGFDASAEPDNDADEVKSSPSGPVVGGVESESDSDVEASHSWRAEPEEYPKPQFEVDSPQYLGMSVEEQDGVRAMKKQLPPRLQESNATLLRFLRARKGNVPAALQMYTMAYYWRKGWDVDNILDNVPHNYPILRKIVTQEHHGYDKIGRPVFIHKTGRMMVDAMCEFSPESMMYCHIYQQEEALQFARQASKRFGKHVSQFLIIMDLAGLNMSCRKVMQYARYTSYMDGNYYPELMGQLIMINAPRAAPILWKMVKPMLDPVTQQKVVIMGSNYHDALAELIDPYNLPREYGGKCRCCGPRGCLPTSTPEEVAEAIKDYREIAPETEMFNVAARYKKEVLVVTDKPEGATFEFYFKTAKRDINFAVKFEPAEVDENGKPFPTVEIRPNLRYHSEVSPVHGTYTSRGPGALVLTWDNSFSYWTSKDVHYMARVVDEDALRRQREAAAAAAAAKLKADDRSQSSSKVDEQKDQAVVV
eukprot:TRINITY_DN67580_c7_g1_i1.p1 TRINITY_DN67580_c7_g1~~TRINITY_DN67580_c7_g1_i1.p1  ORF type:complete len:497 (+),score=236.74 TRINITY_DN67580_c7_g1_i1:29-1492(+)